jgi:predicted dehydrogenase
MSKIRAVLAGCGGIAAVWIDAINAFDDVEVVGVSDISLSAAEKLAEKSKDSPKCYNDVVLAIKECSPDAVFDCTPPEIHKAVAAAAFGANCHLLGEKPISDDIGSAMDMVKTAADKGLIYAIIQNRRYDKNIIACRESIAAADIGKLTTVNADFYIGAHFGGFRDEMADVLLADMAIHTFDQARLLTGCDPVSVYCYQWNPLGSWYKGSASAVVIFEMTGGVVFNYRGSWCAEGMNTTWESDWRIIGTKGSILWDGGGNIRAERVSKEEGFIYAHQPIEIAAGPLEFSGHAGVIREFLDCVKSGRQPQTAASDNIKSFAMVHAAIESSRRGVKMNIEDYLNESRN